MILNIRGTNGSGKTTVATSLLTEDTTTMVMATQMVPAPTKKDPDRFRQREVVGRRGVNNSVILGSYTKSCGGCDEFSWKGSHDCMVAAIRWGAQHFDHVVFEGLTVTSSFGRYIELADDLFHEFGQRTHWLMMTVDLEECIRRVAARNNKPTTDRVRHNVTKKNETVLKTVPKLRDHINSVAQVNLGHPLTFTEHTDTQDAVNYASVLINQ